MIARSIALSLLLTLAVVDARAAPALAAWPNNPARNLAVCTATQYQAEVVACSDGAGGMIVAWSDRRSGTADVYAQRVSATGALLWAADGVAVCNAPLDQSAPAITSDGAGGAILAWQDGRSGFWDLYAQRIDGSGAALWDANGVAVCTVAGDQTAPHLDSDGAHGAFVCWQDGRAGSEHEFGQWLDASGAARWTANGLSLQSSLTAPLFVVGDGAGGAFFAWDGYAQHVLQNGSQQWGTGGYPIMNGPVQAMVADDAGGFIVYGGQELQHATSTGALPWTYAGIAIAVPAGSAIALACDSAGTAVLAWAQNGDIDAARVGPARVTRWVAGVCSAPGAQGAPRVTRDGQGGTLLAWQDARDATFDGNDLYAQRLSSTGAPLWAANGVAVSVAPRDQDPPALLPDGGGGVFAAWTDHRSDVGDVYAEWLNASGVPGGSALAAPPPGGSNELALSAPGPSPTRAGARMRLALPLAAPVRVSVSDAQGRRVRAWDAGVLAAGTHELAWDGRDQAGRPVAPGVWLVSVEAAGQSRSGRIVVLR
ncbi:MAG TPA: FlgD immunoglobulin-like domain containing protein [Candidatus Eisenbacteria bacterium]|nr:FlgD immunoglobulin-like domain containing protein [Candidatus Eisenbacteria bacterium]